MKGKRKMFQPKAGWDSRHQNKLMGILVSFMLIEKSGIVGVCPKLIRLQYNSTE